MKKITILLTLLLTTSFSTLANVNNLLNNLLNNEYKNMFWTVDSVLNLVRYTTNGVDINGHKFGFSKIAGDCKSNYMFIEVSSNKDINELQNSFIDIALENNADANAQITLMFESYLNTAGTNRVFFDGAINGQIATNKLIDYLSNSNKVKLSISSPSKAVDGFSGLKESFRMLGFNEAKEEAYNKCINIDKDSPDFGIQIASNRLKLRSDSRNSKARGLDLEEYEKWGYSWRADDDDNPINMHNLAVSYGDKGIISKATYWYSKAADRGFKASVQILKTYYEWLEELLNNPPVDGDAQSKYEYARTLLENFKLKASQHWMIEAANDGHIAAMLEGGSMYITGSRPGLIPRLSSDDFKEKFPKIDSENALSASVTAERINSWLDKASEGDMGFEYDLDKGIFYTNLAFQTGDSSAKDSCANIIKILDSFSKEQSSYAVKLRMMFSNGICTQKSNQKALFYTQQAAEQGHAPARYNLALMYDEGKGVLEDDKEAVKWYTKSAEQGYAPAQYNLGWMYRNGKGVLKDYKEAVKWYTKAAEQGHAKAQYNLGWMYRNGKGVLKDYKETVKWYTKSAEQGYAPAQYNLGVRYGKGEGVLKDSSKAKYWIKKAYENPKASSELANLAKKILKTLGDISSTK